MQSIPDTLIVTHLEMKSRADFRPAHAEVDPGATILRMDNIDMAYYKFLYQAVGEIWRWRDRLVISDEELQAALSEPGCSVHVLYVEGIPAGYIELLPVGPHTEIAYFGLRPAYIGKGYGKYLLSHGIETAWNDGAQRVWVHTCNLDGPHALDNYRKRGFTVFKVVETPMPDRYA